MNFQLFLIIVIVNFQTLSLAAEGVADRKVNFSHAINACEKNESWKFSSNIFPQWREAFSVSLLGKSISDPNKTFTPNTILSVSHAFTLRTRSANSEEKSFSEYWIARSFYAAGLTHLAHLAFTQIITNQELATNQSTYGIRWAALECDLGLMRENPLLEWPQHVASSLLTMIPSDLPSRATSNDLNSPQSAKNSFNNSLSSSMRELMGEALLIAFEQAAEKKSSLSLSKLIEPYRSLFPHEASYIYGFNFAIQSKHAEAIQSLRTFSESVQLSKAALARIDSVRIQLARSSYSQKDFAASSRYLRAVSKQSNDLAQSLSELSWAYLQNEQYGEAIGSAINLQQGGLHRTFEPEAPMVMAMSYNELCQFPDSIRAIDYFNKQYKSSFDWLSSWNQSKAKWKDKYYQNIILELKSDDLKNSGTSGVSGNAQKHVSQIPPRVISEWVRMPYFISAQEDINLWIRDTKKTTQLNQQGEMVYAKLLVSIASLNAKLKKSIPYTRARLKPGEELPYNIRYELSLLQDRLIELERLKSFSPKWKSISDHFKNRASIAKQENVREINQKVETLNRRMLSVLDEISDNLQLVEVEIYNSATQDIIWQNSNPEYAEVAKELKLNSDRNAAENEWHWGRTIANLDEEGGEVWEDELGNFRANLVDNCTNKDKFLAVKSARRK